MENYSYSAISSFKSCPRSFEFKYVQKIPEAFFSIEVHMGRCVHETLRWAYEKKKDSQIPPLASVKEQYAKLWNGDGLKSARVIKASQNVGDYFDSGGEMLTSFFQRVFLADQSHSFYLEHKFTLPLEKDTGYTGVIDRVSQQPEGQLRVTDFKTGKVSGPLDTLQLPSYGLYVFENHPEDRLQLCFEDLREGRTVVVSFEREQCQNVKKQLLAEINQIRETDAFETRPSLLCMWCGYNHICPNPHESVKDRVLDRNSVDAREKIKDKNGSPGRDTLFPGAEMSGGCPQCGGALEKRTGRFGPFMGCSNYPQCRYTIDLKEFEKGERDEKEICPECGGVLKERKGKFGTFVGCSAYPGCRYTRDGW